MSLSTSIKEDSKYKAPMCTRCRNHKIFFQRLKGHRNSCPFKSCTCKDCGLIDERRLVAIKPQRRASNIPPKSNGRKRTSKELEDRTSSVSDETLGGAATAACLLPLPKRKEPSPNVTVCKYQERSTRHQMPGIAPPHAIKTDPVFLSECASVAHPPLPYGYTQCPPAMPNYLPTASASNMIVNMPRVQGMVVPERPNWMVGYPTLPPYSAALYHQGFLMDSSQMDLGAVQSPPVMY